MQFFERKHRNQDLSPYRKPGKGEESLKNEL